MQNTKQKFSIFLCTICMFLLFPISAKADIGPKPSVRVQFENMGNELCYGTLLSERETTGPYSVWDGNESRILCGDLGEEVWRAFVEYEDTDGYYFLQEGWQVSETKEIEWTYYPPDSFKILLYYPEKDTFVVSDIYEKYAFDSYYTVDMDGMDMDSVEYDEEKSTDEVLDAYRGEIEAYRTHNHRIEVLSLIARIILTIIIEIVVAIMFGIRKKKQLLLLIGVNTATQIILNLLLNLMDDQYGTGAVLFFFLYILAELFVFAIEAVVYCLFMNKWTDTPKKKRVYIVYALVANVVSFGLGLIIAQVLPEIF